MLTVSSRSLRPACWSAALPQAILQQTAPIFLRYRSTCPHHVRVYRAPPLEALDAGAGLQGTIQERQWGGMASMVDP